MGRVSGDKGKFHRERRKKIARREVTRALRASWAAGAPRATAGVPQAEPARAPVAAPEPPPAE